MTFHKPSFASYNNGHQEQIATILSFNSYEGTNFVVAVILRFTTQLHIRWRLTTCRELGIINFMCINVLQLIYNLFVVM